MTVMEIICPFEFEVPSIILCMTDDVNKYGFTFICGSTSFSFYLFIHVNYFFFFVFGWNFVLMCLFLFLFYMQTFMKCTLSQVQNILH